MKPVAQTRFFDPTAPAGQQRGNCWNACLASLLELPIEDVPDFVQIEVDGGREWWTHTLDWLADRGYTLKPVGPINRGTEPYIQCGLSPRSPAVDGSEVHHAAIYQEGELLHDPYPGGTGVTITAAAFAVVEATP